MQYIFYSFKWQHDLSVDVTGQENIEFTIQTYVMGEACCVVCSHPPQHPSHSISMLPRKHNSKKPRTPPMYLHIVDHTKNTGRTLLSNVVLQNNAQQFASALALFFFVESLQHTAHVLSERFVFREASGGTHVLVVYWSGRR